MANPNLLTRADLVLFLIAGGNAFDAHLAVPITNTNQDNFEAAWEAQAVILGNAEQNVVDTKTAYEAAVNAAQTSASILKSAIQETKYTFKSLPASLDSYAAVGLTPPKTGRSAIIPLAPTIVAVLGRSNATNELRFTNNNKSGSVAIEIWRRVGGPTESWMICGTTTKSIFVDSGVPMGELTEYKLKAVAARGLSEFSNTAALYTDPVTP